MMHLKPAGLQVVGDHRLQQFRARRRERMRRLLAERIHQRFARWQRRAFLHDEAPEALAVAFFVQRAGQQSQVDAAAGFIPGAERAGGDISSHALGGAAQEGEFPVVNRTRAVCAEMGYPAGFHQGNHDARAAVLDEMRAV